MSTIHQTLITGLPHAKLDLKTRELLKSLQPGGYILFSRNIESPGQCRKLIEDLYELSQIPPLICLDQEGGRVSRLKAIGEEPPSASQLRDGNDLSSIQTHGELTGKLLRNLGFNLNLCPVLDPSFDDEADNSLKGRTWGKSAEEVVQKASIFNRAMRLEGIFSCAKHFPGYSGAPVDPHHDLPEIRRTREQLQTTEWRPYNELSQELDCVMLGHAYYPELQSSKIPTSLSAEIIEDCLRSELAFKGCVMTDDLDMGAITEKWDYREAVQKAKLAGNDLILLCHQIDKLPLAAEALQEIPARNMDESLERISALKKRLPPLQDFSLEQHQEINKKILELRIAVLGETLGRQRSPEDGKRSPVEIY